MHGNFERGETTYPYAYLRAGEDETGPLYRITDMRTLAPLAEDKVPLDVAVWAAAGLNELARAYPNDTREQREVQIREMLRVRVELWGAPPSHNL
jgi:hypothetical protein